MADRTLSPSPDGLGSGLWGVLATPFDADLDVDHESLARQVSVQVDAGAVGLVALGVFGESGALTPDERRAVVATVHAAAPDLPLVVGIAERETEAAAASGEQLLAAADPARPALMLQVPTPEPDELTRHLHAVHEHTGAGIVVQDYPVVSGVTIDPAALVRAVADCPFVVAVKSEAPPTAPAIAAITAESGVPVFGGLGGLNLLDELLAGASGAMTGFSHPEALAATVRAWRDEGYAGARAALLPWLPLINFEAQVRVGLSLRKRALYLRGVFDDPSVRPPSLSMPSALEPALRAHLAARPGDRAPLRS